MPRPYPQNVEGRELHVALVRDLRRTISPGAAPTEAGAYVVLFAWLGTRWREAFGEDLGPLSPAELETPRTVIHAVQERLARFAATWPPGGAIEIVRSRFFASSDSLVVGADGRKPQ